MLSDISNYQCFIFEVFYFCSLLRLLPAKIDKALAICKGKNRNYQQSKNLYYRLRHQILPSNQAGDGDFVAITYHLHQPRHIQRQISDAFLNLYVRRMQHKGRG